MTQGTTPTLVFELDIEPGTLVSLYLTFRQGYGREVTRRCKRQFPCLNLRDGTCEVAFTHRGVADNHRFLKRLHIVTKDNIQCLPVGRHTDTHIREAKTQKHQLRLSVRDLDAVLSVQIG